MVERFRPVPRQYDDKRLFPVYDLGLTGSGTSDFKIFGNRLAEPVNIAVTSGNVSLSGSGSTGSGTGSRKGFKLHRFQGGIRLSAVAIPERNR